ncbi:uncharacterized protein LOC131858406 [Cryptomeria japonica]|uniref:uncharacterized protein LOC131858406 n=1 Tax=Cryptomeria japonica TaxID=3369 RepID=UPI0027DA1F48|nr:uncharacterized protein LOC131858406 [Cryptomeria japonica]
MDSLKEEVHFPKDSQASDRMKKFADRHRKKLEFNVGDKVLICMDQHQFKVPKGLSASLVRQFDGPFEVIQKINPVACKLHLPLHSGTHPVFHASQLRPHHPDEEDLVRNIPHRGPANVLDNPKMARHTGPSHANSTRVESANLGVPGCI